jgi:beta-glucan synthesis-associated protein KRE6
MVLWRLATDDDQGDLIPPRPLGPDQRASVVSTISGESIWSLSSDSKYPSAPPTMRGSLVPYAWDPLLDDDDAPDEDDVLHQPDSVDKRPSILNPRGILNVGVLILLLVGLLGLFIALPVITYVDNATNNLFNAETAGGAVAVDSNNNTSSGSV